nr:uncharacterized protein LOC106026331 [Cavia porcellus]
MVSQTPDTNVLMAVVSIHPGECFSRRPLFGHSSADGPFMDNTVLKLYEQQEFQEKQSNYDEYGWQSGETLETLGFSVNRKRQRSERRCGSETPSQTFITITSPALLLKAPRPGTQRPQPHQLQAALNQTAPSPALPTPPRRCRATPDGTVGGQCHGGDGLTDTAVTRTPPREQWQKPQSPEDLGVRSSAGGCGSQSRFRPPPLTPQPDPIPSPASVPHHHHCAASRCPRVLPTRPAAAEVPEGNLMNRGTLGTVSGQGVMTPESLATMAHLIVFIQPACSLQTGS